MRTLLLPPLLLLIMILGTMTTSMVTLNTTNISITNSTQTQNVVQKIPTPPPNLFLTILNLIAQGYNMVVNVVQSMLQSTILKEDPSLVNSYANIIAWLTTLTAIYITLTFVETMRKFIGYMLVIGWLFMITLLILAR